MSDPRTPPVDDGSALHRPLDASRLRDIVASELREHRDVHHVELGRSIFSDRLNLDATDHAGRTWRLAFLVAPVTTAWSRP